MSGIERELYDLEEHLRRNDDSADSSTYLTIVGIANDVSEIEAKNAKLRELCVDMMWTIKHAHGWYKDDTHNMLMTDVRGRDGEPSNVSHSLTIDEEMYERRMRKLGIEVPE